ncbi:unnamed protein product [Rotaria sp. Silwood2]|nr:unnamed protein product [Rotaria sp. Silwood2]CAF2883510.1 unnamed protein product [Rotaria sp. Silwood2]CAF3870598.1 unnamed protein product [Rotaria sp. Silwood2]CAF3914655.1 unnamed protein product [Rotaria sp. Silwood2]
MSLVTQTTNTTSVFIPPDREALSLMTKLKLDRFKLRKKKFDEEHIEIMKQNNDSAISLYDKVYMLKKSVERLFDEASKERYLKNFDPLLTIAKVNTSTSNNVLENFRQQFTKVIVGGKKRSEYNYLFGLIMSQWLSEQKNEYTTVEMKPTSKSLLTNEHLEKIIFNRPQLDLDRWRHFLQNKLFSFFDKDAKLKDAFEKFKNSTEQYGKLLLKEKVSYNDIRQAIDSLISNDSLDEYRKRLLTKMRLDENTVNEFASSLNLLISDLTDWNWPINGVRGIFRRNLVGKYRCFYEEDFLTAIFLEHLGLKWSYHFKLELKKLFRVLNKKSRDNCSSRSIQYERCLIQEDEYWMASLPDGLNNNSDAFYYANMDKFNLKSKLFYLINVEIQLHKILQPNAPFTVVSADLEWFGPSISHEIVHIFLEFCGMSQIWLDFFDRFLKQPVYYKPDELIRQRQRGVPISHSLSHLFAELLLFGLDLYIYQNTNIFIYRLHDDIWFFNSQSARIEQAWTLMNEYTQMIGLRFNEEKCGSTQIQPSNMTSHADELSTNAIFPRKDVKWGLLTLQSSGRFTIYQETIRPFLDEMKIRLTNATTILEWVNLYNKYISFFMRNFGQCANILGAYHIEHIIETFQYLHRYIFPETNGNALLILTSRIVEQFPSCLTDDICEAWFYWPWIQGGLGLKNIYLTLYSVQQCLISKKITTFDQLLAKDAELYADIEVEYKQAKKHQKFKFLEEFIHDDGILITFDEYIQGRETQLSHWEGVYTNMLDITPALSPTLTNSFADHMEVIRDKNTRMASRKQRRMNKDSDSYLEWLLFYYGEQIQSTFNQLDFIDSENLPIGLITLMKTAQIDWNNKSKEEE